MLSLRVVVKGLSGTEEPNVLSHADQAMYQAKALPGSHSIRYRGHLPRSP